MTTTERTEKDVMLRAIDAQLWADVKRQADADGMYLVRWIENALRRELARTAKKTEN